MRKEDSDTYVRVHDALPKLLPSSVFHENGLGGISSSRTRAPRVVQVEASPLMGCDKQERPVLLVKGPKSRSSSNICLALRWKLPRSMIKQNIEEDDMIMAALTQNDQAISGRNEYCRWGLKRSCLSTLDAVSRRNEGIDSWEGPRQIIPSPTRWKGAATLAPDLQYGWYSLLRRSGVSEVSIVLLWRVKPYVPTIATYKFDSKTRKRRGEENGRTERRRGPQQELFATEGFFLLAEQTGDEIRVDTTMLWSVGEQSNILFAIFICFGFLSHHKTPEAMKLERKSEEAFIRRRPTVWYYICKEDGKSSVNDDRGRDTQEETLWMSSDEAFDDGGRKESVIGVRIALSVRLSSSKPHLISWSGRRDHQHPCPKLSLSKTDFSPSNTTLASWRRWDRDWPKGGGSWTHGHSVDWTCQLRVFRIIVTGFCARLEFEFEFEFASIFKLRASPQDPRGGQRGGDFLHPKACPPSLLPTTPRIVALFDAAVALCYLVNVAPYKPSHILLELGCRILLSFSLVDPGTDFPDDLQY
ncbi:hypothetical protein F5146DRAFT_1006877 [Armillaria mellea]|nr:hypothetical protein F5146DRAFT_1006877 [Armillaria mellea]